MPRYAHSTDNKGRVIIPSRLREALGLVCYVTVSLDRGYLSVYTDRQWQDVREQLDQLPGTNPVARRLRRTIIGEAIRCQLDSQGRIAVNDELWSSIQVEGGEEVYIIDLGDSLQICSRSFFDAQRTEELGIDELDLSEFDVKGIL